MASGHRNGPARGIQRGVVVTKSSSTAITPRTGFLFVLRSLGQAFEGSNCGLGKPGASLSRHSGKEIIWRQKSEARNRKSQSKTVRRRVSTSYLHSATQTRAIRLGLRHLSAGLCPTCEHSVATPRHAGHDPHPHRPPRRARRDLVHGRRQVRSAAPQLGALRRHNGQN